MVLKLCKAELGVLPGLGASGQKAAGRAVRAPPRAAGQARSCGASHLPAPGPRGLP